MRFSRWARCRVWQKVFEHLAADADNEYAMIDSTIGRSRGGLSTKVHATADALGSPTGFHLTPGQACDLDRADILLPVQQAGKAAVIPPKANRKHQREYDKDLYKARHLIENFFAKLKTTPRHRHPLRQNRSCLPRCHLSRCCSYLADFFDDTP